MGLHILVLLLIIVSFSFAIISIVCLRRYLKDGEFMNAMHTAGCGTIAFITMHAVLALMVYKVILF